MSIIARARRDANKIVSNRNGFAIPITFSTPSLNFEITVYGTAKKHHTAYDEMGNVVNTLQASVTVSEKELIQFGYPVRNDNGEVALKHHKVTWDDAQGTYTYLISEWHPDEHLGLLVLLLNNAKYVAHQQATE